MIILSFILSLIFSLINSPIAVLDSTIAPELSPETITRTAGDFSPNSVENKNNHNIPDNAYDVNISPDGSIVSYSYVDSSGATCRVHSDMSDLHAPSSSQNCDPVLKQR